MQSVTVTTGVAKNTFSMLHAPPQTHAVTFSLALYARRNAIASVCVFSNVKFVVLVLVGNKP